MKTSRWVLGCTGGFLGLCTWVTVTLSTVNLNLTLLQGQQNLQVFFLEDLNLSGESPANEIFAATLTLQEPDSQEYYFHFLMGNSQLSNIIDARTENFWLPATVTNLRVTNLDLTTASSPYSFDTYEISDQGEAIKENLLQAGYFPNDVYSLRLELHRADNTTLTGISWSQISIVITNPFTIQLISPAGTPDFPTSFPMTTPPFSWSSQALQFFIKICERTQINQDPESVMQENPNFQTNPADPMTAQNFIYPAGGVQPLEAGHTYYWQVTSQVETSSGMMTYFSPIGAFYLEPLPNPDLQRIIAAVQQILANQINALDPLVGFQPNGILSQNGSTITIDQLESLVPKFQTNDYTTTAVIVEE